MIQVPCKVRGFTPLPEGDYAAMPARTVGLVSFVIQYFGGGYCPEGESCVELPGVKVGRIFAAPRAMGFVKVPLIAADEERRVDGRNAYLARVYVPVTLPVWFSPQHTNSFMRALTECDAFNAWRCPEERKPRPVEMPRAMGVFIAEHTGELIGASGSIPDERVPVGGAA